MTTRRLALAALLAASAVGAVQLSGAVLTSSSSSAGSVSASPDWTPPLVAVSSSPAIVGGTAAVSATASDAHSSVSSVRLQVRPEGSAAAWTVLCTATTAPYSCPWTTTTSADGRYDVQAVAVDAHGNTATSATVQRIVDNTGPVVVVDEPSMPDYLRGTVTVPVLATDAGAGVASVRLQRSTNGSTWTDICTDTTAPYSCSWATSGSGDVLLRAIAVDAVGSSTTSAVVVVTLDNTPPTVTMASPGSTLSGTVTLTATASDADSGVASVLVEQRASSTSPWVAVCTATTSPYTCRWDTTKVADGTTYAFRATATDLAGNTTVSAVTATSTVDNRLASVSLEDPGAYLRGTAALVANANAPGGVASVTVQYAPTGTTSWTTICVDTSSPYGCSWDTTKVADGGYDLRAVMTPVSGATLVSNLVTGRVVDNALLRGHDVQATNGGSLGRIDSGDTLVLTYDSVVDLDSVVAGWTGGPRAVVLRGRDGASVGGASSDDVLDLFTSTALTTPVALGSVSTRGDYIKGGQSVLLNASMTAETTTVNGVPATRIVIRVETLASALDGRRGAKGTRTMLWTPSAAARDLAGNAAAVTPTTETGALDRDF